MKNFLFTILFLAPVIAIIPEPAQGACCVAPADLSRLVSRFAPVLMQGEEIPARPELLVYRAKTSDDCRTLFLAYHVVWPYEQDPRPGLYPAITRLTYTGGLKLQRIIYGPGDVEVIGLVINLETMRVIKISYESADYDKKGEVIHVPVSVEAEDVPGYFPLAFRVVSWNHMFELVADAPGKEEPIYRLRPEPFTEALWRHFRMTKTIKGPLSRDRAHHAWELEDICPLEEDGLSPHEK